MYFLGFSCPSYNSNLIKKVLWQTIKRIGCVGIIGFQKLIYLLTHEVANSFSIRIW